MPPSFLSRAARYGAKLLARFDGPASGSRPNPYAPPSDPLKEAKRDDLATIYRDLPVVQAWIDWNVDRVRRALREHVSGVFTSSATLVDDLTGDDRIMSSLRTRVNAVAGRPFELVASEEVEARLAERAVESAAKARKRALPRDVETEMRRCALLMGFAIAEIVWDTSNPKRWVPYIKVLDPRHCYYDITARRYVVQTLDGPVFVEPGNGKWFVYSPHGEYRGWMFGAVRALAIPWLIRQFSVRDWARWSEKYGMGVIGAKAPAAASDPDKERFVRQIANLGRESTVLLPQGINGQNFDLAIYEAQSRGWDGFEGLIQWANTAITLTIQGQTLTTEVKEGSLAAARVHGDVRQSEVAFDAESFAEDEREQLWRPYCFFNHDDADLAPTPKWDATPAEDKGELATATSTAAEALSTLASLEVPVDVVEYCGKVGIPLRSDAGDVVLKPPPAMPSFFSLSRGRGTRLRSIPRRALVEGQIYADALADKAIEGTPELLEPMVALAREAIDGAKSYDDVRRRLLELVGNDDDPKVREWLERTIMLSLAAGSVSQIRELDR